MNRPIALVCHICGREFGTKSLAIHVKACEKKWENQQNLKPPKERRPCPQPPKGFNQFVSKPNITKKDIQSFNTQSYDTFVEDALVGCEYCGRKFNPKSLIPHQKACKISPMIKKPYISKAKEEQNMKIETNYAKKSYGNYGQNYTNGQNDQGGSDLTPCRKCGRKFNSDRVGKHQRVCKADPVGFKEEPKYKPPVIQKENKMKPKFQMQKKPKWKVQHEQFQNALKMMKQMKAIQAKGGKISDLPPPPKGNYDHYIECKYCGRKYAPDVAERHIPKCANIINKPGGIKPSKIQEKYIQGTGANTMKPKVTMSNATVTPHTILTKPNMNVKGKPNTANKYW